MEFGLMCETALPRWPTRLTAMWGWQSSLLYAPILEYYCSVPPHHHLLCPLLSPTSTCPTDKPAHAFDWAPGKIREDVFSDLFTGLSNFLQFREHIQKSFSLYQRLLLLSSNFLHWHPSKLRPVQKCVHNTGKLCENPKESQKLQQTAAP